MPATLRILGLLGNAILLTYLNFSDPIAHPSQMLHCASRTQSWVKSFIISPSLGNIPFPSDSNGNLGTLTPLQLNWWLSSLSYLLPLCLKMSGYPVCFSLPSPSLPNFSLNTTLRPDFHVILFHLPSFLFLIVIIFRLPISLPMFLDILASINC